MLRRDIFAFKYENTGTYDPVKKCFRKRHYKWQLNGVADIIGIYNQRPLAIEVKSEKGRMSTAQKEFARNWQESGGIFILARSIEDVEAGLQNA